MTRRDYVFVPDSEANGDWVVQGMDSEYECVERIPGPIVVISLKELKDVFDAGWKRAAFEKGNNSSPSPNFNDYIANKGINI